MMKKYILAVLSLSLFLTSCQDDISNVEKVKLFTNKLANGDTTDVRSILADTIYNYSGEYFDSKSTINQQINNILTNKIFDGFYEINEVVSTTDNTVTFTTNEYPGYIADSFLKRDTFSFQMTYYFDKGKINKITTDTLTNRDYCYSCINKQNNAQLSEFFNWISDHHPSIDSIFFRYYNKHYNSEYLNPNFAIDAMKTQKEYFKLWQNSLSTPQH